VLTDAAFGHMIEMAERFEAGVNDVIAAHRVPWNAVRLGCRVEYHFQSTPPRNGSEAVAADDAMLGRYMHLHALNRGILLTPFHNMALMCPATSSDDVDRHTTAFNEAVEALVDSRSS
jgi:glutamate-1-semialdehyde 2,1-aminomutase